MTYYRYFRSETRSLLNRIIKICIFCLLFKLFGLSIFNEITFGIIGKFAYKIVGLIL